MPVDSAFAEISSLATVWIFNVFGTIDLLLAITLATVATGPSYRIPALWVPLLLVTHYMTFD